MNLKKFPRCQISKLLLFLSLSISGHAGDLNSEGFKLYQTKKYKEAQTLFKKEISKNPKNHFAWLNLARTTSVLNKGHEPNDYCVFEKNWILLSLSYLSQAMELSASQTKEKIEKDSDGLKYLKERPEFFRWKATWDTRMQNETEIKNFIADYPNFTFRAAGEISQFYSFEKDGTLKKTNSDGSVMNLGQWSTQKKTVSIKISNVENQYQFEVRKWYFNEGKNFIDTVYLVSSKPNAKFKLAPELELGDINQDCM